MRNEKCRFYVADNEKVFYDSLLRFKARRRVYGSLSSPRKWRHIMRTNLIKLSTTLIKLLLAFVERLPKSVFKSFLIIWRHKKSHHLDTDTRLGLISFVFLNSNAFNTGSTKIKPSSSVHKRSDFERRRIKREKLLRRSENHP